MMRTTMRYCCRTPRTHENTASCLYAPGRDAARVLSKPIIRHNGRHAVFTASAGCDETNSTSTVPHQRDLHVFLYAFPCLHADGGRTSSQYETSSPSSVLLDCRQNISCRGRPHDGEERADRWGDLEASCGVCYRSVSSGRKGVILQIRRKP